MDDSETPFFVWPPVLSARQRSGVKLLGLAILLVGFSGAGLIWQAEDRIDRQAATHAARAALAPDDSRRYTHDMEQYYGETGLLADKSTRWFEAWMRGKPLAATIAVLSFVAGGGCFLIARISKNA